MPGRYLGNSRYHIFRPSASDFSHNATSGKQGGTGGEYFHLSQAQHDALSTPGTKIEQLNTKVEVSDTGTDGLVNIEVDGWQVFKAESAKVWIGGTDGNFFTMQHDAGHVFIVNTFVNGDIHLSGYVGVGPPDVHKMATFRPDGGVDLRYNDIVEMETVSGALKATNGFQIGASGIIDTIETTLTNDNEHFPTSGAVFGYINNTYEPDTLYDSSNVRVRTKADGIEIEGPSSQLLHIDAATGTFSMETQASIHFRLGVGTNTALRAYNGSGLWLYYANTKEAETISGGFKVSNALQIGSSGLMTIETTLTDDDTKIPSSGAVFDAIPDLSSGLTVGGTTYGDGLITDDGAMRITIPNSSVFHIRDADNDWLAAFYANGACELYHNNVNVLQTSAAAIKLPQILSGATQGGAGAAAGELWVTSGHATLDDNIVMMGV